jgi:hypothetical protein
MRDSLRSLRSNVKYPLHYFETLVFRAFKLRVGVVPPLKSLFE